MMRVVSSVAQRTVSSSPVTAAFSSWMNGSLDSLTSESACWTSLSLTFLSPNWKEIRVPPVKSMPSAASRLQAKAPSVTSTVISERVSAIRVLPRKS